MAVTPFNRTLDQEILALGRGVSLECLVCGEFVLHEGAVIVCPECGCRLAPAAAVAGSGLQFQLQAG